MPDKENFQHYQHLAAAHHHPQFNFWPHPNPFHAAQSAAAAAAAASGMSSHQHNPFAQYYAANPGHHPFAGGAPSSAPSASAIAGNPLSSSATLGGQKYGHSPFFPSMAGAAPNAGHLNHPAFGLSPTSGAVPPSAGCSSKWGQSTGAFHGQPTGNAAASSAFSAFQGNGQQANSAVSPASGVNDTSAASKGGNNKSVEPVADKQQSQSLDRKNSAVENMDIDVVHNHHNRTEDTRRPQDSTTNPEDNKKSKSKG